MISAINQLVKVKGQKNSSNYKKINNQSNGQFEQIKEVPAFTKNDHLVMFTGKKETKKSQTSPIKAMALAAALCSITPQIANAQHHTYSSEEQFQDKLKIQRLRQEVERSGREAINATFNLWGMLSPKQQKMVKEIQNLEDLSLIYKGTVIPSYKSPQIAEALKVDDPYDQVLLTQQLAQAETYQACGITNGENADKMILKIKVNQELFNLQNTKGRLLEATPENIAILGVHVKAKPSDYYSILKTVIDYSTNQAQSGVMLPFGGYNYDNYSQIDYEKLIEMGNEFNQKAEDFFKPIIPLIFGEE